MPVVETELKPFLQEFNFQAEKYVDWIVPTLLIRTLMQTGAGQQHSNDCYQVELAKQSDSKTMKAIFLLSAATTLNMAEYSKKDGSFYEADFRAKFDTVSWVLRRGVPEVMEACNAGDMGRSARSKPAKLAKSKAAQQAARAMPLTQSKLPVSNQKKRSITEREGG
jgi:Holliday junction resolvase YEN1